MMSVAISAKKIPNAVNGVRPDISRGSKRSPYRTKSYDSQVDETLFGSPSRYTDQKETPRIVAGDVSWDPPWVTSPTKAGVPLLWTPYDPKGSPNANSSNIKTKTPSPKSTTPRTPRNKYRIRKLVPSYVDETLFGTPLKEPEFDAPWDTKVDKTGTNPSQVTWSPHVPTSKPVNPIVSERVELKSDKKTSMGRGMTSHTTLPYSPVIKARPGSAINTPKGRTKQGQSETSVTRMTPTPKIYDFGKEEVEADDPQAIIDRALRLAGIYPRGNSTNRSRSNSLGGMSSRAVSPGGYFWKRPLSSASSTGKPETSRSASRKTPRTPKEDLPPSLQVDDLFSASGRQVVLSARSAAITPRGRPNSARTEKTLDSVPGLDLKLAINFNGTKRPASARSARSASSGRASTLTGRPSWRP